MNLLTENCRLQTARWPAAGRHILAQFDDDSIIVYQAYQPAIGRFAVENGCFGGPAFGFGRMSWIKPNFLWMMYRCGWATRQGQEVVLAIRVTRAAFDEILRQAVHSTYVPEVYDDEAAWKTAVADSEVRLQWDPDHDPNGAKLERRAIQLGLRGSVLTSYAREWIVSIEDVTEFVRQQHALVVGKKCDGLVTPRESVYPLGDPAVRNRLGIAE
jgi:hypothetical protein